MSEPVHKGIKGNFLDTRTLGPICIGPPLVPVNAAAARLQAWLDADDATHFGQHEKDLQTVLDTASKMRDAMQLFCDRVDRGEVRSKRTYASFKEILA